MSGPLPERIPTIEEQAIEIQRLKRMVASTATHLASAKQVHDEAMKQYEDARRVLLFLIEPEWNETR